jgi:hypothetical protein
MAKEGLAMASKRQRDKRLQIMLAPEELRAVDNFRFKKRITLRAFREGCELMHFSKWHLYRSDVEAGP